MLNPKTKTEFYKPKSEKPIRLALLGASRVGKSTLIQNLATKNFIETYYPTLKSTPILLEWFVNDTTAKLVLNEYLGLKDSFPILDNDKIILSSNIINSLKSSDLGSNPSKSHHHRSSSSKQMKKIKKNSIYDVIFPEDSAISSDSNLFEITPILLELIDTPHFNPTQIVPFLEASLDVKLPADILHNLANEPRRDHSLKPLIVASGANDMNGNVDGYFFVYSCIPSLNPPGYNDEFTTAETTSPLDLLVDMRKILDDAWSEYTAYKKGWEVGGEGDIFSFVYNVKSLWKKQSATSWQQHSHALESFMPPIVIVCTHCDSDLKSPKLIQDGKKLAKFWNCGFVEMDNLNLDQVDILTSLLVRDIVEKNYIKST